MFQMYGEKVEEVEELRLDLEDVKEMYKLQVMFENILEFVQFWYFLNDLSVCLSVYILSAFSNWD